MSEFERFALALAWTESGNQETVWGDHGLAVGRWQMHPVWYAEWADPAIQVGWSWDTAFRAALLLFWDEYERQKTPIVDRALIFHLGASAFARGVRDRGYADRFATFWNAQSSENKV